MVWNDSSGVCEQESAQGQEGKKGIYLTTEIISYLIAQTYFIYLCIKPERFSHIVITLGAEKDSVLLYLEAKIKTIPFTKPCLYHEKQVSI